MREDAFGDKDLEMTVNAIRFPIVERNEGMLAEEESVSRNDSTEALPDLTPNAEAVVNEDDDDFDDGLPELQSVSNSSDSEEEEEDDTRPRVTTTDNGTRWFWKWPEESAMIELTRPVGFRDAYRFPVTSPEHRLDILRNEKLKKGRPKKLGHAPSKLLEYLLEMSAPYPGDPANFLQFRGPRFEAEPVEHDLIRVIDH
ncbi:hypothetical protein H0H92_011842, partial [Tricholoma furcatifolium]